MVGVLILSLALHVAVLGLFSRLGSPVNYRSGRQGRSSSGYVTVHLVKGQQYNPAGDQNESQAGRSQDLGVVGLPKRQQTPIPTGPSRVLQEPKPVSEDTNPLQSQVESSKVEKQSQNQSKPRTESNQQTLSHSFRGLAGQGPGDTEGLGHSSGDRGDGALTGESSSQDSTRRREANLIHSSFIRPAYTIDAEQAGVEGEFLLDVLVGAQGQVLQASLRRRIGYGMDRLIETAMQDARFHPALNDQGLPIQQWTEVVIRLSLVE